MGNRQDPPSSAPRPVLPRVLRVSESYSDSPAAVWTGPLRASTPAHKQHLQVKATFSPRVFTQNFIDTYLTHNFHILGCPSSKPAEMKRGTSLKWEDMRTVRGTRTAEAATGSLMSEENAKLKSTVWQYGAA